MRTRKIETVENFSLASSSSFFPFQKLSLLREVVFDQAFMFAYSLREKTHAHRNYAYSLAYILLFDTCLFVNFSLLFLFFLFFFFSDDVPAEVKNQRLKEVIDTFHELAKAKNQKEIGTEHIVLVEGVWKLFFYFFLFLFFSLLLIFSFLAK